jgi:phosphoglycerate kinase
MRPVAEALIKMAPHVKFYFFGTPFEHASVEIAALRAGECLILESTRRDAGEETNDSTFIQLLSSFADMFVGDAFAEAHRDYASNVAVAKLLPCYMGILMREEIEHLDAARAPKHPSFAILGGAKFETKAPLVDSLLRTYDHLFVTGALADDVFKARGLPIGGSTISAESPNTEILNHPGLIVPIDVTIERVDGQAQVKKPEDVLPNERIVDMGPDTLALIAPKIAEAKFILWNGPTGLYERGYDTWTEQITRLIAKCNAHTVIGGGDTIAAIERVDLASNPNIFLSTGGGAMLEYLLKGNLPAIDVLDK